jgi:ATP-binding protein involved in chromosome partitioning
MLRSVLRRFASVAPSPLPSIGRIILAASCKGGVGKSTVALNTAVALSELGNRVGLFDADFYGPSIPTMTSTTENVIQQTQESHYLPIPAYGIETFSLGNGIPGGAALLWKGTLIGNMVDELLKKTLWSTLDYLIVDTPPGTGDVQIALSNSVKVDGVILVTSPQEVAVADVVRNLDMFGKLKIPVLGIVQNFDGFVCPRCKKVTRVFPGQGGKDISKTHNIEFLASLAVDPLLSQAADEGFPAVLKHPDSPFSHSFRTLARRVMMKVPKPEQEEDLKIDMELLDKEIKESKK